jgi:hypothetical protein
LNVSSVSYRNQSAPVNGKKDVANGRVPGPSTMGMKRPLE